MTPAEMAALHAACFTSPPPWSAAAFADLLADPTVTCLTEPQAVLLGRVAAGEAEVLTLAVHPERRRQGVALRLVALFHAKMAWQADTAFLEVASDNAGARALYHRMGYRLVGTRRAYYRNPQAAPVDALILRRDLSGSTAI